MHSMHFCGILILTIFFISVEQLALKQELYLTDQANDVHMGCSCITSCELAGHQGYNVLFVEVIISQFLYKLRIC